VKNQILPALIVAALLPMFVSCGSETSVAPEPAQVAVEGSVEFPSEAAVDLAEIEVAFGESESELSEDGGFSLRGNPGRPGLAMAYGEDELALLMAIVPDPAGAVDVVLDARSTALALAFLNPFVCNDDPTDADEVLERLSALPELDALEAVLITGLAIEPDVLLSGDDAIDAALTDVLAAYLNSYALELEGGARMAPAPQARPALQARAGQAPQARAARQATRATGGHVPPPWVSAKPIALASGIDILPDYETGGLRLTHTGGSQFKMANSIGRWAQCVTPEESFYLFPNGTLLDVLKGNPWAPSERAFSMDVPFSIDPKIVSVYGLGWAASEDNLWDSLSAAEQELALDAGMATVLLEFVPQIVSVVTNCSTTFGQGQIGKTKIVQLLTHLKHQNTITRSTEYIRAGDPMGLVKFLTETIVSEFIGNEDFRASFIEALGMSLSEGALKRAAGSLLLPVRAFLTVDAITNSVKTALGFYNARFKTAFEVWKMTVEVGNIMGGVYDSETGMAIEGASVVLEGDDDNPFNPAHNDVTSGAGLYYFENIGVGTKTILASKDGYASGAITVTVVMNSTVTAPQLILDPVSGALSGRVLDGVLLANSAADAVFTKELDLQVTQLDGDFDHSYSIYDGTYQFALDPGTYLVRASNEYYHPDSVQVTVTESGAATPRDLILQPANSLYGTIRLDRDGDGSYESHFSISTEVVGAWIAEGGLTIEVVAVAGSPTTDVIQLIIALNQVQSPGTYDLGDGFSISMGGSGAAGVLYMTSRQTCYDPDEGVYSSMVFSIEGDPAAAACNCGITDYGDLFVTNPFGIEIADVVAGGILSRLAGSRTCSCWCCADTDGDGQVDDWVSSCSRAELNLTINSLLGTMYLVMGSTGEVAIPLQGR